MIVVRSVVGGGAAARDGRLAPGDRLVSVNGQHVARAPLAAAVAAIKAAPPGNYCGFFITELRPGHIFGAGSGKARGALSSMICSGMPQLD